MPGSLRRQLSKRKWQFRAYLESHRNRKRTASDVFSEIYENNIWGGEDKVFFSGSGSRGRVADEYIIKINNFIEKNKIKSVVDIGCGDFYIGSRLKCSDYTGIDIVPSLISHHNATFGGPGRRFLCVDVSGSEALPSADLVLIRQVLQHLSNRQIEAILAKLGGFRHVIVTEHQPAAGDLVTFNRDHVHGNSTRLLHGSGVYLERPPFNRSVELLMDCAGNEGSGDVHERGAIRSFLVKP
ncbi:hypothetical protein EV667_1784 [Ancylobacter aquaticus]|uniref:Methyltransferase type 12 domain-containing protein n=1 Tax=Ancylobacter aquaticus TaxID=100 RepID=A0A4R1IBG4_ANCAQ|nr:class I SAM-dependent methyltransferase [Ancylobacter aquaticus]TCK31673.1 hypothetical protein EV667_1784 [Ancylobacter aquaticus]